MHEYDWRIKAAAAISEEQVDRDAAEKAFMDMAYAIVANKGKALFRDPFRIGFEIIDTNEKFTRMHGIFVFRCGDIPLSVPVFFVNGEVLGGDSVYRGDVKRFSPFTDKWCAYLVRKAQASGGGLVDRSTQTQAEAYMQRLSYPQFGHKSASLTKEAATAIWNEMVEHSMNVDDDVPLLVPRLIKEAGTFAIEALDSVLGNSDSVQRYASKIYANADFTPTIEKSAARCPGLYRITDITLCKTAAQREAVAKTGTAWDDERTDFEVKYTTEDILNRDMIELRNEGCADVILTSDDKFETEPAYVMAVARERDSSSACPVDWSDPNTSLAYFPGSKKMAWISKKHPAFGFPQHDKEPAGLIEIGAAKKGKAYILVNDKATKVMGSPFKVESTESANGGKVLSVRGSDFSYEGDAIIYRPDATRCEPGRNFYNDSYKLLEVAEKDVKDDCCPHSIVTPDEETRLMRTSEVDRWLRGVGVAELQSEDYKVTREEPSNLFSLELSDASAPFHKVASSLDRDELVATLAARCDIPVQDAIAYADKATKQPVVFRAFFEKRSFVTRITQPENWTHGYDQTLGTKVDYPQQRNLATFTPQRRTQQPRYGDKFTPDAPTVFHDEDEDGLPETDLMSLQPEELAAKAESLGMPHVLDHQVFSQLATRTMDSLSQVRKYLPDIETGVDRYARILFLLRYRPAEFEQAYGKEETQTLEEELRSLFDTAGDNLLRLLKRFDKDRYGSESQA